MNNRRYKILLYALILPILLVIPHSFSYSQDSGSDVDSEERYALLKAEMDQFRKVNHHLIRYFDTKDHKAGRGLRSSQRKKRAHYLELENNLFYWGKVAGLKHALLARYQLFHPDSHEDELNAVHDETNRLSRTLIDSIARLQKEYGIHTFPLIHNFFIDLKLKKRGACKHWAEDLLKVIDTVDHPHFKAYWGEAHPGNILEHNVAVLVPQGAAFEDGIVIDPWRMAGKPFWIVVKEDSHPWQEWGGYDPR